MWTAFARRVVHWFNVIQVGSTGLPNSQKNYSRYELELTAISWAASKTYNFLAHRPPKVTFYTDHASLAHLESVQLDLQELQVARHTF